MISGIKKYPSEENGGLLLGLKRGTKIYIIEAIETGKEDLHNEGELLLNMVNMEYLANILNGLYKEDLEIIGIWHKHNHNLNPPFSIIDNLFHQKLCKSLKQDIISILFQKEIDNEYSIHVFKYCQNNQIIDKEFDIVKLEKMIDYKI